MPDRQVEIRDAVVKKGPAADAGPFSCFTAKRHPTSVLTKLKARCSGRDPTK
jgi:hypothetical protein